jgi:hypothetical protein
LILLYDQLSLRLLLLDLPYASKYNYNPWVLLLT